MKRRVVSVLIAGILFFSNIGVTSFAANNSSSEASGAASSASTEGSTVDAQKKSNEGDYGEDEISYFKITDFTELPEDISNQKIRVGGKLEDLELPDTLEVTVEPDYEHDERIERGLAQERERIRREELEADEGSSSSSDEGDAASSSDSEDGEKIIFFDEDGTISEEAGDLSSDEDGLNEDNDDEISTLYDEVVPEPENVEDSSDSNTDNGGNDEGISSPIESGSEEHSDGNSEEATDEATEGGLISWLTHTFRNAAVAYAADIKDSKTTDEEASVELISDVEWILEPEYNYGVEEFSADEEGEIYLFTPVLLIPDTYYVEDELPIITVTVTDDYYAFDKETVVDDVKIRVRADKGVFPEDARVTAKKLAAEDEEKVKEVVDEQVDADSVVKEYTFDITIKDKEGYEVQPDTEKGRVVVSFEAAEVADESLEAEVYHIIDEKEVEEEPEKTEAVALGGEREKERVLTIYDENSVLKAEKLEAEVVEFEDVMVLEAATDGFSTYTVVFTQNAASYTYGIDSTKPVNLEKTFAGVITFENGVTFTKNDKMFDIVKIIYTGANHDADLDAGTGVYKVDATYTGTREWFLILKKPLIGNENITVNHVDGTTDVITVKNADFKFTELSIQNDNYPYAVELGINTFKLEAPTSDKRAATNSTVVYQWEELINGEWTAIEGANTYYYKDTKTSFNRNGYMYRCCVNGSYTEAVQIITSNGDLDVTAGGTARSWTNYYKSPDQCYVSNGTIAYTIGSTVVGTVTKTVFDVVGQFGDSMLQTTVNGNGWRIFSNASTDTPTYDDYSYNLDKLYFAFDKNNSYVLKSSAYLTSGYTKFAIGADCKLGSVTNLTTLSESVSPYRIGIMGISNEDDAQRIVNNGQGDSIPSLVVTPITTTGVIKWIGEQGTQAPYASNSVSVLEKNLGVTMSWVGVATNPIQFQFSLAGVTSNDILDPVSKTAKYTFSKTTNITSGKYTNNVLDTYAKSLGEPSETVVVTLAMSSGKATETLRDRIYEEYDYSASSTTSTATTGTTATSAKKAPTIDYLDIKVKNKIGNNTETTVDEPSLSGPVRIELKYNFKDKENIKVFREHGDSAPKLLNESDSGNEGTYQVDKDAGKIYVYASKFSTYAVSSSSVTYYTVTFNDGTKTWTSKVKAGEKVSAPEGMPTKDGVTAQYWYNATLTTSSTSSTATSKPTAYDFNTPVTSNITLKAYYGTTHKVTFSGISPSVIVEVADGEKVARPTDPVKEGYTFKGWYSDKTAKTLYNFDTPVTKDITLYAGFVNGEGVDEDEEEGDVNGARAARTNDTLPPVWLWVLILVSALVVFSCNLYSRAKEGKVKFSNNKTVRKITRFFLLVGLVIVTIVKFLARKVNEKRRDLALAVSGVVVLIAAGVLIVTSLEYHRSERTYEKANKTFVQETQQLPTVTDKTETVNAENTVWWDEASVEMDTLSEEYPDVIGWIYFENEDISYPIMYSGDNTKYLSTSYNGEKAKAGAIFLDGESTPDFSDPHSLIYGHNMRDLSMFGKLRYYKTDASYYDEHQYFQIFTKDGVYRYQIFAYEEVPDSHDVFWVYGKDPEGMWDMLQDIEGGSYRQTGIEATESDHVITLATCTSKEDRRLIVSALRTDEHDYEYVASN